MDTYSTIGVTGFGLLWIAIHLLGLAAAWMVRLPAGRRYEVLVQGGFFASLLAVAMTTVVGQLYCLEMWPLSAGTLALMVVLAIADLGAAEPSAFPLER